jgi:phosphoserine aminotransferase
LVTLIASLIDDKLPFYSSLIRAAERSLTQLAFSEVSKGIVNEKAQSMISNLAKLVVSGNEKCRSTLNLIRVLAYQTTQEYLQRAISRNMEQILKIVANCYIIEH